MSGYEKAIGWRPWYRMIQWVAVLLMFWLLLAGFLIGYFQSPMLRLAFCAFGVFTGAAFARMAHPLDGRLTRMGCVALGFVAASQIFYQMLVWSESWRVNSWNNIGWRLWWATIVAAVGLGWLQVLWRSGARWEWKSGRTTLGFTVGLGLLLGSLSMRPNLMGTLPGWWHALTAVMLAGALIGSVVIIGRWLKSRPKTRRPLPKGMRLALIVSGVITLSVGSFYFGRLTIPPPSPFDNAHSMLATLSTVELEEQLNRDTMRLKKLAEGMDVLRTEADALHQRVVARQKQGGGEDYLPNESREVRHLFIRYIGYRKDLLHLSRVYIGFKKVQDETLRDRCFLAGYCAAVVALEAGRTFVAKYRDNDEARDKLNEGEPGWLESGQFEVVYHSVTDRYHMDLFETYGRLFRANAARWKLNGVTGMDFEWFSDRIRRGQQTLQTIELNPVRAWLSRVGRRLQEDVNVPFYGAQKMMATFMGDTRIVQREPFISEDLVQRTLAVNKLQPGDIILERRNWYLSNAFLPGFWPHCALYVGTPRDLKELGIDYGELDAEAREAHQRPEQGNPRVIIEAISEGVVFTSAEHSMHADYVAVLRLRLSSEQKAEVIRNAFRYHGRPYDFGFDFADESKLVCSELLYYSFGGLLKLELESVLGKKVVTPMGIMNKFVRERGRPDAEMEFVFFLDTPAGSLKGSLASEEACCESVKRAKAFNE